VVVEELKGASAALTARTAPLVPGCGTLVAISGLATNAEPSSDRLAETFVGLAVIFAIARFAFLTRALFGYAGHRSIGLSPPVDDIAPTVDDIAFAREPLARKRVNARRGGWLAGLGLTCLIIGILVGVHIDITTG